MGWERRPDAVRRLDGPVFGLILCLVVILGAVVPVAGAAQGDLRITDLSVDDDDIITVKDGVTYLWQSDEQTVTVTVETPPSTGQGHYEMCLNAIPRGNGSSHELRCRDIVLYGNRTEEITFEFAEWSEDHLGRQAVRAVVYAGTLDRENVGNVSIEVHVLKTTGDLDGDGLTNEEEVAAGTKFDAADTDNDGLNDSLEVRTFGTDSNQWDTDGDGLADGAEAYETGTDPTAADTDGDGLSDAAELREHDTSPHRTDTDGDGLSDSEEINTFGTDPNRPDTDGDGLDDRAEVQDYETDPTDSDTDDDELGDAMEVHTYGTDPRKADTDDDGLDDGVEVYDTNTDPTAADTDGDGLMDGLELNAHTTNPNRADTDGDGLSDNAEVKTHGTDPTLPDTDGDGMDDWAEVQPDGPTVPGWVWAVLMAIAGVVLVGAGWIRRDGYPRRLRVFGLGESQSGSDEGVQPDAPTAASTSVTNVPLPNRERVLALLEENGGRMKQTAIVDATDWSKAKVSRVLMQMESNDQIVKITVGRENVIFLPGAEPPQSRRPFEADSPQGIDETG